MVLRQVLGEPLARWAEWEFLWRPDTLGGAQGWANAWAFGPSERSRSHALGRHRPLPENLAAQVPHLRQRVRPPMLAKVKITLQGKFGRWRGGIMKSMIERVPLFLVCNVLVVGCSGTSPTTSPTRDEAQLARGVAEDLLISTGDASHYYVLKSLAGPFITNNFMNTYERGEWWYEFKAWSITSESTNSGETKATVRGSLQATKAWCRREGIDHPDTSFKEKTVGFRMSLVKEQGKWLVDSIQYGTPQVDNKK